jgi:hypothetical protein
MCCHIVSGGRFSYRSNEIALPENQNQWKMDISEWNKGIYLYTFIAENNTVYNGKLVIVR